MRSFFLLVTAHPRAVVLVAGALALGLGLAVLGLAREVSPDAFIPPDHPALVLKQQVQAQFGLREPIAACVVRDAPGGVFVHVAPEGGEGRQGGEQFVEAMREAGWECQQSAVPPAYHRNVLDEGSDEEFELLFDELKTRTYTLYCYSRKAAAPAS